MTPGAKMPQKYIESQERRLSKLEDLAVGETVGIAAIDVRLDAEGRAYLWKWIDHRGVKIGAAGRLTSVCVRRDADGLVLIVRDDLKFQWPINDHKVSDDCIPFARIEVKE